MNGRAENPLLLLPLLLSVGLLSFFMPFEPARRNSSLLSRSLVSCHGGNPMFFYLCFVKTVATNFFVGIAQCCVCVFSCML